MTYVRVKDSGPETQAVEKLPECRACAKPASYLCKICEKPHCGKTGCPDNDQHHPVGIVLVEMKPYPWDV